MKNSSSSEKSMMERYEYLNVELLWTQVYELNGKKFEIHLTQPWDLASDHVKAEVERAARYHLGEKDDSL